MWSNWGLIKPLNKPQVQLLNIQKKKKNKN